MILSGGTGLEPLSERAGPSTHANVLVARDPNPRSGEVAVSCLSESARTRETGLSLEVRRAVRERLRRRIPRHARMHFGGIRDCPRHAGRQAAPDALEPLTSPAVDGLLEGASVDRCGNRFGTGLEEAGPGAPSVECVLHVLCHNGYQEPLGADHRFESGLLEDWWKNRYGGNFQPATATGRRARKNR